MASPLSPTATFGAETRESLLLPTPGGNIGATLHKPVQENAKGTAVLLLPGWSGPRTGPAELLVYLARELAASGHAAMRIDFHGRGDSSGRFEDGDLDRMIEEAAAGVDYLKQRAPDAQRIAVAGICSGGNVAIGVATLRPKDVHSVAAFSLLPFQPSRSGEFDTRRRRKNLTQYLAKAVKPETWLRLVRGDINLKRVKQNVSASETPAQGERNLKDSARNIEREWLTWPGRALFVWGGGDEEAPPARAHFEKLQAQRAHEANFKTIAGANHNFYGHAWREELLKELTAFCKS